MIFKMPAMRISVGLVLLTINLLFLANQIGLIPDTSESALTLRKALSESLALQFSLAAEKGDYPAIQNTLRAVVERNESIRSAAIRTGDGQLIALAGEHLAYWKEGTNEKSTPTHIRVPLYKNNNPWATFEIRYAPLVNDNLVFGFTMSFTGLLLFIGLGSLIGYFLILKRTLRELDPTAVIPNRVRKAFDALKEGVLILDGKEQVVMANTSFASYFNKAPEAMVGMKGSEMGWLNCRTREQVLDLPWLSVLKDGLEQKSASLHLMNHAGSKIKMAVTAAAVTDDSGKRRGCLVTFDDITLLEEKNFELSELVEKLRLSNDEINNKSKELEFMANRDPMTLCLNRRSLDRSLRELFNKARDEGSPLTCMMVDIDLFKSVNDRYGHATGDRVIKAVADVLKSCTRGTDLVGRYGGEEFCVALPGADNSKGHEIAERMRSHIQEKACSGIKITASFGVAFLEQSCIKPEDLVNQADKALYIAKESGRNRVVVWGESQPVVTEAGESTGTPAEKMPSGPKDGGSNDTIAQLEARVKELEGMLTKKILELQHSKMYDAHTGLPTRSMFEERIANEIARSKRTDGFVAVIALTIEKIKRVDETLGRSAARQLVKMCGIRLNDILREDIDMVAVLEEKDTASSISLINDSEFGILLCDIKQVDHVTWVMKRLHDALEKPFKIDSHDIYATSYIGVSIFPYDGQSAEELYSSAVNACHYAENKDANGRCSFASPRINEMAMKHLHIETCLHDAIANDELELYYQPIIYAASGRVIKFEALLRWNSAELGSVPPIEFIPVAEQTGLINPIGDWVFDHAMKQFRAWLDDGLDVGAIAVNLSGVQLHRSGIIERIQEFLTAHGLKTSQLEVELTESTLVDSRNRSLAVLKEIREMGIRVAMDDFGTGYSSLAYLRDMPLSIVKIDRSFIAGIGEGKNYENLIASIISMAHELELDVVAEGIEEQHQADLLTRMGCDYLQGYYFSRPVAHREAADMLQKQLMALAG